MSKANRVLGILKEEEFIYTVDAGRLILRDGEPFINIQRAGNTNPTEADRVTHIIADLLNKSGKKDFHKETVSVWKKE
jgi:hypothetical protein